MSSIAQKRKYRRGQQFVVSYHIQKVKVGQVEEDTEVFGLYDELEENNELSDGEVTILLKERVRKYKSKNPLDYVVIYNWWLY
jgi:hypothetical protein